MSDLYQKVENLVGYEYFDETNLVNDDKVEQVEVPYYVKADFDHITSV